MPSGSRRAVRATGSHVEPGELDVGRFERLVARRRSGSTHPARCARPLPSGAGRRSPTWPVSRSRARPIGSRSGACTRSNCATSSSSHHGEHAALLAELESLVAEHPYRDRLRRQQVLALVPLWPAEGGARCVPGRAPRARRARDRSLGRSCASSSGRSCGRTLRSAAPERVRIGVAASGAADASRRPWAGGRCGRRAAARRRAPGHADRPWRDGKTRLALAVAEELAAETPARFVDLAPMRDPELGTSRRSSRRSDLEGASRSAQRLGRNCSPSCDNFEQLLDAAPIVAGLLARSPALHVLATSRAPLRLSGRARVPGADAGGRRCRRRCSPRAPGPSIRASSSPSERAARVAEICDAARRPSARARSSPRHARSCSRRRRWSGGWSARSNC